MMLKRRVEENIKRLNQMGFMKYKIVWQNIKTFAIFKKKPYLIKYIEITISKLKLAMTIFFFKLY